MRKVPAVAAVFAGLALLVAAGCEKKEPTPGERLDEAIKQSGDAMKDAQEKAADAMDKASEELKKK